MIDLRNPKNHPKLYKKPTPISLSKREKEVLRCLFKGYTGNKISEVLGINAKTTSTYKLRLKGKLGLDGSSNDFAVCIYAIHMGFISDADLEPLMLKRIE